MDHDYAHTLLRKVRSDYQMLANEYSDSRAHIWPEFLEFRKYLKPGMKVLDIGCGNGRVTKILGDVKDEKTGDDRPVEYVGCDVSTRLLDQAKKLFPTYHFMVADILSLPFPDSQFDAVFCVAVLHQVPGTDLRKKAMAEMNRVLKPGGWLFLEVWNLWRTRHRSRYLKNNFRHILGMTPLDWNDALVPWRQSGVSQYYHAFTQKELSRLVTQAGFEVKKDFLTYRLTASGTSASNNIVTISEKN